MFAVDTEKRVRRRLRSLAAGIAFAAAIAAASGARAQEGRGNAVLAVRGDCAIGSEIKVYVAGGLSAGDVVLLVDPDDGAGSFEGAPLCLANGPNATTRAGALNAKHIKVFRFAIPNDPGLVGEDLLFQAVVRDPEAPDGLAVTNCLRLPVCGAGGGYDCMNGIGSLSGFIVSKRVDAFPAQATLRVKDESTGEVLATLSVAHDPMRGTEIPEAAPCDPIVIDRISTVTRCNELLRPKIAVHFRIDAMTFPDGVLPDSTTIELEVDGLFTRKTIDASCNAPLGVGQKLVPLYVTDLVEGPLAADSRIEGVVFCDDDEDGIRDEGEAGIAGVAVSLHAQPSDGGPFDVTTETDALGRYFFVVPVTGGETVAATVSVSPNAAPGKVPTTPTAGVTATLEVCDSKPSGDFGFGPFCEPATLAGVVYCDEDRNGARDDGEAGLANVEVTLHADPSDADPFTQTTLTGPSGEYSFALTIPRDGSVTASACVDPNALPGKTVPEGRECSAAFVLDECGETASHPFGYEPVCEDATFNGIVYCDDDGNGALDEGEVGIPNVSVTLHADPSDGPPTETTALTDGDGRYSFSITIPRNGSVAVFASVATDAVPGKTIPLEASCSGTRTLETCGGETAHDFGFEPVCDAATFVGLVYCDDNGNGVRDDGEVGIPNVSVTLHADPSDAPPYEETGVTDENGAYGFSIAIPRNGSVAVFTSVATDAVPGKSIPLESSCSGTVVLETCGGATVHDFGFAPVCDTASFAGVVYCDGDSDGVRDPGETGIAGVEVTLHADPHPGPEYTTTTLTDSEGNYSFTFSVPAGGSISVFTSVPTDGGAGKSIPLEISCSPTSTLRECESASHDFGYRPGCDTAAFTGVVYCDDNANGVRDDGEDGMAGIEVTLHANPHPGPEYTTTTLTDSEGRYSFTFDVPEGGSISVFTSVPIDGGDGKSIPLEISCSPTSRLYECESASHDFGYRPDCDTAAFTGVVYCDGNANGVRDDGEPGIPNVSVTLHADPSPGPAYEITTTTGADGRYEFVVPFPNGGSASAFTSVALDAVPGKRISEALSCSSTFNLNACGETGIGNFGFAEGIPVGDFITFTHGGWGARCEGGNPGCLRDEHFDDVFPNGMILGDPDGDDNDGIWALVLTTSTAVKNYLPDGGTPSTLTGDLVNPTSTPSKNLASQLTAATLSVAFNDAGFLVGSNGTTRLGDLIYVANVDSNLIGLTVRQVLAHANHAVAGQVELLPAGVSLADLATALAKLNENFDNGTVSEGTLGLP